MGSLQFIIISVLLIASVPLDATAEGNRLAALTERRFNKFFERMNNNWMEEKKNFGVQSNKFFEGALKDWKDERFTFELATQDEKAELEEKFDMVKKKFDMVERALEDWRRSQAEMAEADKKWTRPGFTFARPARPSSKYANLGSKYADLNSKYADLKESFESFLKSLENCTTDRNPNADLDEKYKKLTRPGLDSYRRKAELEKAVRKVGSKNADSKESFAEADKKWIQKVGSKNADSIQKVGSKNADSSSRYADLKESFAEAGVQSNAFLKTIFSEANKKWMEARKGMTLGKQWVRQMNKFFRSALQRVAEAVEKPTEATEASTGELAKDLFAEAMNILEKAEAELDGADRGQAELVNGEAELVYAVNTVNGGTNLENAEDAKYAVSAVNEIPAVNGQNIINRRNAEMEKAANIIFNASGKWQKRYIPGAELEAELAVAERDYAKVGVTEAQSEKELQNLQEENTKLREAIQNLKGEIQNLKRAQSPRL